MGNSFKASTKNDMGVHHTRLKLTLMGLLGDISVLLLVEVFFVGVWGSLLVLSLCFLKFRPEFYGVIHAME